MLCCVLGVVLSLFPMKRKPPSRASCITHAHTHSAQMRSGAVATALLLCLAGHLVLVSAGAEACTKGSALMGGVCQPESFGAQLQEHPLEDTLNYTAPSTGEFKI